ncbi:MAG: hypothetical protein AMXMBFR33_03150 [Candidatus Xenobia bacterium]
MSETSEPVEADVPLPRRQVFLPPPVGQRKNPSLMSSLDHAAEGLVYAVRRERNLKIHFVMAVAALLLCLGLDLNALQLLCVAFAIVLVIITELINTAIETMINLMTTAHHPLAKVAKDVSAGAVLVASINALVVAYLIMLPPLMQMFNRSESIILRVQKHPAHAVALAIALILVAVLVGKAVGHRGTFTKGGLVSGHAALAFGSATAIVLITRQPLVAGLALLMSALVAHSRVEAGIHQWREVALGALCGTTLSLIVFYLFQVIGY